jgi:hypothetical protein
MLYILVAAVSFGVFYLIDRLFTKLFRSQSQHRSGLSVRVGKRYALFGVFFGVLGILGLTVGIGQSPVLIAAGGAVLVIGGILIVYYLSFGIFYDADTFLLTAFGKKSRTYSFSDIEGQKLYVIQGGSVVIELYLAGGETVSLQSTMDGTYPFLDHAFAAWCRQTGKVPEECAFHDPSQSLWFPTKEDA